MNPKWKIMKQKNIAEDGMDNLHIGMGGPFPEHCFLISFVLELYLVGSRQMR
jgi:hypothetical protein